MGLGSDNMPHEEDHWECQWWFDNGRSMFEAKLSLGLISATDQPNLSHLYASIVLDIRARAKYIGIDHLKPIQPTFSWEARESQYVRGDKCRNQSPLSQAVAYIVTCLVKKGMI
jgi:hypothetical protein